VFVGLSVLWIQELGVSVTLFILEEGIARIVAFRSPNQVRMLMSTKAKQITTQLQVRLHQHRLSWQEFKEIFIQTKSMRFMTQETGVNAWLKWSCM
jgi:hypothetical protein